MKQIFVQSTRLLVGSVDAPPDKSISHRALILNSLAFGEARIENLLEAEDIYSTIRVLRALGVSIEGENGTYLIRSKGYREPLNPLDCGNSGTTMRLMMGVLSAHPFLSILVGDSSLSKRPMKRVITPLKRQGVSFLGRNEEHFAPLAMRGHFGGHLSYALPIPSAQLKSALLLHGLQCSGARISKIGTSRDHTERMLVAMGVLVEQKEDIISIPPTDIQSIDVLVPGDPSSAAFFIAAGILTGGELQISSVGTNPTRIAFVESLITMGADISFEHPRIISGEPIADIIVRPSTLKGIEIDVETIPAQLDELPLLAVVAVFAEGETVVRGAEELRVKESDRIRAIVHNLKKMGADIEELPDGFIVKGTGTLTGVPVPSFGDHRIAMACAVAGLVAEGETVIQDSECVAISFPDFVAQLSELGAKCWEKEE